MTKTTSIKVSDNGIFFLKKLMTNRRKTDIDEKDLSYSKLVGIITKYFKINNNRYLELVKIEVDKNV